MIVQKHHEVIMIEWPAFNDDGALDNFRGDSASFRFNQKKTVSAGDGGTKNVEIMITLNFFF